MQKVAKERIMQLPKFLITFTTTRRKAFPHSNNSLTVYQRKSCRKEKCANGLKRVYRKSKQSKRPIHRSQPIQINLTPLVACPSHRTFSRVINLIVYRIKLSLRAVLLPFHDKIQIDKIEVTFSYMRISQ